MQERAQAPALLVVERGDIVDRQNEAHTCPERDGLVIDHRGECDEEDSPTFRSIESGDIAIIAFDDRMHDRKS